MLSAGPVVVLLLVQPGISDGIDGMIVTCEKCGARYKLDDGKVTGRGAKITCPRCKHVFVVFPDVNEADMPPPTAATTMLPKAPTRSAESLDFRKVGIPSWKVKVRIGLVYDFSDIKTLRKYIADGRVTSEDVISHDGATWVTIGDIPDLDAYFVTIYERAEVAQAEKAARASGGGGGQGGFEDEDTPTMIVGMSSLGNDIAAEALKTSQSDPGGRGPSPATPSGEGPFVDPFAALRSKQRDRAQQQRRPGAAAAAAGAAAATKANQAEKRSPLPFIGLAVLLALAAGWYFTMGPGAAKPPADPTTTDQAPTDPADGATAAGGGKSDLQKQIDQTLKEVKPIEMTDEPTRTAVRPNDPRTKAGGAGGATTPPDGGTTSAPIDHAANCRSFGKQGDWGQAAIACASATAANAGDGALLAWHGMALYNTGKKSDAAAKLNAARKAGGMPSEAYKVLGHIARDNGDVAGAKGYYQQYLSSNPSDKAAIEAEITKLDGN